jgi:hypothetical protein
VALVAVLLALWAGQGSPVPLPAPAPAPSSAPATALPVDIDGNLVLVDEVYLAALDLPAPVSADPATARSVERQLLAFLRRAGYALAAVDARPNGGRIEVTVDEGRLSRIVVRGQDVVVTVAVRLQIDLPYDVFNRPQLERLLQRYRGDGARVDYDLVPARAVRHSGLQVNPLALVPWSAPLPAASKYELHVEFTGVEERGGFTLVAGIDPDSIRVGGVLSGVSALLSGDLWELEAQVGANFFEDLDRQADEFHFSRALVDARWLAPTIGPARLRPTLRVREDLLRRQRQDLGVETYWWNRLEGAIGLSLVPWAGIELTAEAGAQQRDLFAIDQMPDGEDTVEVRGTSSLRAFTAFVGRLDLEPTRLRMDRRHRIDLDARYFPALGHRAFWQMEAQYRKVIEFGWNDLWLRGAAGAVGGGYGIADAIPMTGRYLRGVYGHAFYLDRAAAAAIEYRLSLTRDIFKVGVFHEVAVFREARMAELSDEIRAGNSFGPSFHALVLDALQLDFFYAAGFTSNGDFDHGVSLRILKAF